MKYKLTAARVAQWNKSKNNVCYNDMWNIANGYPTLRDATLLRAAHCHYFGISDPTGIVTLSMFKKYMETSHV